MRPLPARPVNSGEQRRVDGSVLTTLLTTEKTSRGVALGSIEGVRLARSSEAVVRVQHGPPSAPAAPTVGAQPGLGGPVGRRGAAGPPRRGGPPGRRSRAAVAPPWRYAGSMAQPRGARTELAKLAATYGEVQLATLAAEPPTGPGWSTELKADGYRIVALKADREVRLISRRTNDWTAEFRDVARAVAALAARELVLDGEVCAVDERGVPSFELLQNRASRPSRLVYIVFDVLERDGEDLRAHPFDQRRVVLTDVLGSLNARGPLVLSTAVSADPRAVLTAAREAGLEGIVCKQVASPYVGGRSRTWIKVKCYLRQEFAIVGWIPLLKTQPRVGSLVLGLMEPDGQFHFAGKVGTGFTDVAREKLHDLLLRDASPTPTAVGVPSFDGPVKFVAPRHVAEVRFLEWSADGIRHPSYQGLRRDKRPEECVRERPARLKPGDDLVPPGGSSTRHRWRRKRP